MNQIAAELSAIPAHIPRSLVRDFDFFHPPGMDEDLHLAWKRLQNEEGDFFWTPRNGGHWVITRAEDILEVQTNHQRFSQRVYTLPPDPEGYRMIPVNVDPPEHGPYRSILMPAFMPRAIKKIEDDIHAVAQALVDEIAPRGECEFVEEFANQLPIAVFLKIVDLPFEDRAFLLPWAEDAIRSPDRQRQHDARANMAGYMAKWMQERRARPGDDLISTIAHANVGDRPITDEEALSLLSITLFGGLDTVSGLLGFVCRFLALNPGHRRELIAHPELRRNAVEELIRRHGIANTARYVTEDFRSKGVEFKAGDLVLVPNSLFGLDDRINADPLKVDFRRDSVRHAAFGNGPHTCPGAVLARRELNAFLDCWLERIPDFRIKPGSKPIMACGSISAVMRLELEWEP